MFLFFRENLKKLNEMKLKLLYKYYIAFISVYRKTACYGKPDPEFRLDPDR